MNRLVKVLATVAVLSVLAGVGLSGVAGAETSACGASCTDISSAEFTTTPSPYLLAVAGSQLGSPIVELPTSTINAAEDFELLAPMLVSSYCEDGLGIAKGICGRYGEYEATELQFAPEGVPNGLCAGIAVTGSIELGQVMLEPCGVSDDTLWAEVPVGTHFELINLSSQNVANPAALTALIDPLFIGMLPLPVNVSPLTSFFTRGPSPGQLWNLVPGGVPYVP